MSPLALLVHALGWALIHSLWQAAVIALGVRLALAFTTRPGLRATWAVLGSLAVALAAVGTAAHSWQAAAALGAGEATAPLGAVPLGVRARLSIERALPLLVAVWACGAMSLGARQFFGWLGVLRLRRRARALRGELAQACARLAEELGIDRAVALAESAAVEVPVTVGWLRPLVLLPLGLATRLDRDQLEAAIAHELAHVRRHDYLINLVQAAVEAAFFFHPCVWWLGRVLRREREHACDDLVVAHSHTPAGYARALLALEEDRAARVRAVSSASADLRLAAVDGVSLGARVRRLLEADMAKQPSTSKAHSSPFFRSPRAWASSLVVVAALLGAATTAACLDKDEGSSDPETAALVEGRIEVGDDGARLDIPWLPERVAALGPEIEAAARRHGVDPNLLAIVTLVESGGDAQAQSPTGARGLMQIMPATAERIAGERGLSEHSVERLDEPAYNLDLGAWYLARQLERWGEVEWAAAAYNGGEQAVEAALSGEGELSEETRRYQQIVSELWRERGEAESATLSAR